MENGHGPCVRAALALKNTLEKMSVVIHDDEQLVGHSTAKRLADVIPVERGDFNTVLELELDRLTSRKRRAFLISEGERRRLEEEVLPRWRDRTVRSRKVELWKNAGIYRSPSLGPVAAFRLLKGTGLRGAWNIGRRTLGGSLKSIARAPRLQRELAGLRPNLALTVFDVQGHFVPGYRRVLELGFAGIAEMAVGELARLATGDPDRALKEDFLRSASIAAKAVCAYSERYASLALEMAAGATGERAAELGEMAGRCRRVPALPPRGFIEALQSIWMAQVVFSISYGMAGVLSPGRVDQYLYPFYASDLEKGLITRERALEAIEEYMIKLGTCLIMLIEVGKGTASEMGVGSNTLTVGGLEGGGEDATNELSYLFIEAHGNLRAMADNLSVRISSRSPEGFLEKACESYRLTSGLALFNDDLIVGELREDGFSLEDARDYSIVGCVEPTSTGNCFACTAGNDISLAGVLEMALNGGRMLFSGGRVGARTPDAAGFESFEELRRAFAEQLSWNVDKLVRAVELLDRACMEEFPSPLLSSALEGCLESGMDMTRGGAVYDYGSITARGLGTVANSLAAVRWAVFETGLIGMRELMKLLRNNFRKGESIRREILSRAPKYGNDDDAADELAEWVAKVFADEVRKHACARGRFYRPGIFSYGVHVLDGLYLGATPDGRLAGDPVSNGISPVNGTERSGPTAVLHSASRAASAPLSDGTALNMRLSPQLIDSRENMEKLASLVKGYFAIGGRHVQFNVVDTETLLDAQAHPERYPDLVVRVSGYCAYFTDLGRPVQDDIIARTSFDSMV